MNWSEPGFGRKAVDRAGKAFIDEGASATKRAEARAIINNWRSSHSFPLNTLTVSLRNKAVAADPEALVARRIKRLPSIRLKLERFPNMKLSQMHDLGGARAVLDSIDAVRGVESRFLESQHKHALVRHDDYITKPQDSGYRGVHLVYKYNSDKSRIYNNLRIEIQLRSKLMHAWATAVETVGTFTKQSLKSSLGDERFLRLFTLMSATIAHEEGAPFPPNVPESLTDVYREVVTLATELRFTDRMAAYTASLNAVETGELSGKYTLLHLDIATSVLNVNSFDKLNEATAAFDAAESMMGDETSDTNLQDVVLVSVEKINGLRAAFPNYFLDTTNFIQRVQAIVDNHDDLTD